VRDAEIVRAALVPKDTLGGRWTILGQSFGGFCCVTYLSIAPQGAPSVLWLLHGVLSRFWRFRYSAASLSSFLRRLVFSCEQSSLLLPWGRSSGGAADGRPAAGHPPALRSARRLPGAVPAGHAPERQVWRLSCQSIHSSDTRMPRETVQLLHWWPHECGMTCPPSFNIITTCTICAKISFGRKVLPALPGRRGACAPHRAAPAVAARRLRTAAQPRRAAPQVSLSRLADTPAWCALV